MVETGRFEHEGQQWLWSRTLGGSRGTGSRRGPGPGQWLLIFARRGDGTEFHTFALRSAWPDDPSQEQLVDALARAQRESED